MLEAVLFDLDDTLLANDMNVFLPEYVHGLAEWANPCRDKTRFVPGLRAATQRMMQSTDERSNAEVFWEAFQSLAQVTRADTEPLIDAFIRDRLPKLRHLTRQVPFARELVEHCFSLGLPVVIATNPVFPRGAIETRLSWAGLPVGEFHFAQVTSYENSRATKPHVAYYRDIVAGLGVRPEAVLMVGNSRDADIFPAQAAGLQTLQVHDASSAPFEGKEWQLQQDVARAMLSDAPKGSLRAVLQFLLRETG
jgi:FMN phosphatase YigB (HAD superfamily)